MYAATQIHSSQLRQKKHTGHFEDVALTRLFSTGLIDRGPFCARKYAADQKFKQPEESTLSVNQEGNA
jgi:hypothetical protein